MSQRGSYGVIVDSIRTTGFGSLSADPRRGELWRPMYPVSWSFEG